MDFLVIIPQTSFEKITSLYVAITNKNLQIIYVLKKGKITADFSLRIAKMLSSASVDFMSLTGARRIWKLSKYLRPHELAFKSEIR